MREYIPVGAVNNNNVPDSFFVLSAWTDMEHTIMISPDAAYTRLVLVNLIRRNTSHFQRPTVLACLGSPGLGPRARAFRDSLRLLGNGVHSNRNNCVAFGAINRFDAD